MVDYIQKAEDARRKKYKDKLRKNAAKTYYSSIKGYEGKAGGQNPNAKSYTEKRHDAFRADVQDAARSGQTMKQLKYSGAATNLKKEINKIKKDFIRISKGRK